MDALVVNENGVVFDDNYLKPKASKGEVLVEVALAGICSTDLEITKGYMGFTGVLGHEFVGHVVKGSREWVGKRVVGSINNVCSKCDMCLSGLSNHCRDRSVLGIVGHDGAFAKYLTIPIHNLYEVPDVMTDEQAVFVEPVAAVLQITQQLRIEPHYKVAVIGDGRLGLLAMQVLAEAGTPSNTMLVGKHEEKFSFCEKRGLQCCHLDDMVLRPQWDIVVDCTGSASGFETAVKLLRPRGTLVLKSTFVAETAIDLTPLVINEITVVGSRCGPFQEAINAIVAERVIVNGLITSQYKFADGIEALEKAKAHNQIKVTLAP